MERFERLYTREKKNDVTVKDGLAPPDISKLGRWPPGASSGLVLVL
jgi:hypothetical protein